LQIFDYINDILSYKKGDLLNNVDDESAFNGYMINRWLSMYSPNMAQIINDTTNRMYSIFETKKEYYNFLVSIIPVSRPKRIYYIKKNNKTKTEKDDEVTLIAKNLELSEREINYYKNQQFKKD
jgi:hypothetical protein